MTKATNNGDKWRGRRWMILTWAIVVGGPLAACTPSPRAILARGTPCGDVRVGPDVTMRLTGYTERLDSTPAFAVHACDAHGRDCRHVASYLHAPRPAYAIDAQGRVVVEIFGGSIFRKASIAPRFGREARPVVLRQVGRGRFEDVGAFLRKTVGGECRPSASL